MKPRVIAVDWSGSKTRAERKIWLAEVDPTTMQIIRLEADRDREALTQHLIEYAASNPNLIVGFDFAFSLPAWFLRDRKFGTAAALWAAAASDGEDWLVNCNAPFWGRPGKGRAVVPEQFRKTDCEVPAVGGIRPKSVFQIGGAGAVGTGSIRGMPMLAKLAAKGFSIWPFAASTFPLVVEIYPRALTDRVNKTNRHSRQDYVAANFPSLDKTIRDVACSCDDAFDAMVSALIMAAHVDELTKLTASTDETTQLEGRIWLPAATAQKVPAVSLLAKGKTRAVGTTPAFNAT